MQNHVFVFIQQTLFRSSVPNYLLYQNSTYGIKIKYPDRGWGIQNQENFRGEVVKFFPTHQTKLSSCPLYVFINVSDFPEGKIFSVDEYKDIAQGNIKKINPNTQITDSSNSKTTLSNLRAYKLFYNQRDGQCNLKAMEIGTVRSGKAYFITYKAEEKQYSQLLPIVKTMINSFQIMEDN